MANQTGKPDDLPRLPEGTTTFIDMVSDSIHTIPSRKTSWRTAAHLFGERYGFLLALMDAFGQREGREAPVQRMLDMSRGITAHAKKNLQNAWTERADAALKLDLDEVLKDVALSSAPADGESSRNPLAKLDKEIDAIDRHPDRVEAAIDFAELWARLRQMSITFRALEEKIPSDQRAEVHDMLRSLAISSTWSRPGAHAASTSSSASRRWRSSSSWSSPTSCSEAGRRSDADAVVQTG